MNATFDLATALKVIGSVMKEHGITHEQLRAQFPNRPTTETECGAVAAWLGEQISKKAAVAKDSKPAWSTPKPAASPVQPSSPQFSLPANTDKSGKPKATRYAVVLPGEDKVRFFRVKAGRKAGFYFVDEQASDDLYPVRGARRNTVLQAIAKDPQAALALYGQEIGACGRCGHTLTSEYRKLGIGPVCIYK